MIAPALNVDPDDAEALCETLSRHQYLVRPVGLQGFPDGSRCQGYEFVHALYREVCYWRQGAGRRAARHRYIGERLEALFAMHMHDVASELAYHFEAGADWGRAITYLQMAADTAVQRYAYREAAAVLQRALTLVHDVPAVTERTRREFELLTALGPCLMIMHGMGAAEVERIYRRAYELCQLLQETPQLFSALQGLRYFYWVRVELHTARELESRLLALAQSQNDPALLTKAHMSSGLSLMSLGEFALALQHFEQGLVHCESALRQPAQTIPHPEIACLLYSGLTLWLLGYPEQAQARMHRGLNLSEQLAHPPHQVWGEHIGAIFYPLYRAPQTARACADAIMRHAADYDIPFGLDTAQFVRGWALIQDGEAQAGIEQMRQANAVYDTRHGQMSMPRRLVLLAEVHGNLGQIEAGLQLLARAHELIEHHGDRSYWAEAYRLKGKLLQQVASGTEEVDASAEVCLLKALAIAREQQAKIFELRAAMSLSRIWQRQGQGEAARELLTQTYAWFTEGFDSPDLQEAQALLAELAGSETVLRALDSAI